MNKITRRLVELRRGKVRERLNIKKAIRPWLHLMTKLKFHATKVGGQ